MVKQIVKDPLFLKQKSEPVTEADKQVIVDLMGCGAGADTDD